MDNTRKQSILPLLSYFIAGAIFGLSLIYFILHFARANSAVAKVMAYPALIVRYVDGPLDWLCDLFNSNMCIGLGFDGGPLEWVEWTAVYLSMAISYGLLFVLIYKLVRLIKNKFAIRQE